MATALSSLGKLPLRSCWGWGAERGKYERGAQTIVLPLETVLSRVCPWLWRASHALPIKASLGMVYHSCSERGTEVYSAGILKLTDEDAVCRGVGQCRRDQHRMGATQGPAKSRASTPLACTGAFPEAGESWGCAKGPLVEARTLEKSSPSQIHGQERLR